MAPQCKSVSLAASAWRYSFGGSQDLPGNFLAGHVLDDGVDGGRADLPGVLHDGPVHLSVFHGLPCFRLAVKPDDANCALLA